MNEQNLLKIKSLEGKSLNTMHTRFKSNYCINTWHCFLMYFLTLTVNLLRMYLLIAVFIFLIFTSFLYFFFFLLDLHLNFFDDNTTCRLLSLTTSMGDIRFFLLSYWKSLQNKHDIPKDLRFSVGSDPQLGRATSLKLNFSQLNANSSPWSSAFSNREKDKKNINWLDHESTFLEIMGKGKRLWTNGK